MEIKTTLNIWTIGEELKLGDNPKILMKKWVAVDDMINEFLTPYNNKDMELVRLRLINKLKEGE